jgi:BASS family bile acid:Na+ symporter
MTDWGFFIVLYSMIGVNRDLILSNPFTVFSVAVISFCTTFVLGSVIQRICAFCRIDKKNMVSLVLLGTLKNQGIAGGLAMLFEKEAAIPSAIYSIF